MNDEIKSAREIAMEKIAALDAVTEGDRLKWKFVPEGEQLALKYLKDGQDIASALSNYTQEAQPYVRSGVEDILLSNIQLPVNETIQNRNKKAIDGVLSIKKDKNAATKLLNQMKQILGHYTAQGAEQRKQTYEALKQQFEAKLKKAVSKQLGSHADTDLGISVETLPQFQEEWRRAAAQMDEQYIKLLEEFKHEMSKVK
ncbi:MAG: hypothetical protein C4542_07845 [Dehalococcoidia bacterium]|nr:MAG: hypothetical protein C4542_07845 [Dehalococcoidia bacterium]